MKRDMELIRYILLQTEAGQPIVGEKEIIVYHIVLLKEAGFVETVVRNNPLGIPSDATILKLTWAGHNFLDAARDDKIWHMAKEKFIKPRVSWTVSMILEWLKQQSEPRRIRCQPRKRNGDGQPNRHAADSRRRISF
jgi:hypothetical protein